MRVLNLVWSAVWWNEGLYIAGNPFKGPRAHLDLAVVAHGLRGLVCILPWLVWPSPCRWAEAVGRCTSHVASLPVAATGGALALRTFLDGKCCFCALFLQAGQWDSDHTNGRYQKELLHHKQAQQIPFFWKVIKVIDTMPTCPATKTPLGGTVETPYSNSQTEQIFSHFLTLSSQFQSHSLLISGPHSPVSESAVQAGWQDGWVPTAPGFD